jgi:hypothetical protein
MNKLQKHERGSFPFFFKMGKYFLQMKSCTEPHENRVVPSEHSLVVSYTRCSVVTDLGAVPRHGSLESLSG